MKSENEREKISKLLNSEVRYLKIDKNSKVPSGRFSVGCKNNLASLPKKGNYGVIPGGKIIILDIDTHLAPKGTEKEFLEKQKEIFEQFFQIDFSKTFCVSTPSGGLHVYLKLPVEAKELKEIPGVFKTSLRPFAGDICKVLGKEKELLDADFRSGIVQGYCLGAGSSIGRMKYYRSNEVYQILEIPEEGYNNILKTASIRIERLSEKLYKTSKESGKKVLIYDEVESEKSFTKISDSTLKKLKEALALYGSDSEYRNFHSRRAFVKAALHCCANDNSVAETCEKLGLNRDSYSGRELSRDEILFDLSKFNPIIRSHGKYCPRGLGIGNEKVRFSNENGSKTYNKLDREAAYLRRLNNGGFERPRVLDLEKTKSILLNVGAKRITQEKRDALLLIWKWFQPLANIGATSFLVSSKEISKNLGITPLRLKRALQVLKRAGIIRLSKRAYPGRASFWKIEPNIVNEKMTSYLKSALRKQSNISGEKNAVVWNPEDGSFTLLFSNEKIFMKQDLSEWSNQQIEMISEIKIPKEIDFSHAKRYCRQERETAH